MICPAWYPKNTWAIQSIDPKKEKIWLAIKNMSYHRRKLCTLSIVLTESNTQYSFRIKRFGLICCLWSWVWIYVIYCEKPFVNVSGGPSGATTIFFAVVVKSSWAEITYIYMSKEFHVSKALWYRNLISTSSTTKTKFEKTLPLGQPGTERPKTIAVCTMTKIAATIHLCQTDSKSAMCRFQSFWKSIK